ncbi:MAG: TauD/TfdA family dioxygenase [Minwuia sp.]|uniref:TauD/TfdA family dioxygenase n=1 Tax=Minwuia sp. TaxID=2493630 RepID=UPI003A86500B
MALTDIDETRDLPPPPSGPSVWTGREMMGRSDWIQHLDAATTDCLGRVTERFLSSGRDLAAMTRADMQDDRLEKLTASWNEELLHGRGFLLIRGMPVGVWPHEQVAAAYYGLGLLMGVPRSQNAKGHLLGHVRDLGLSTDDPRVRIYQTTERQTFHTDSCDVVGLLCLKTAKAGGESAIASSMAIYAEMYRRRPDLLAQLFHAFPTDRRGEIPPGKKAFFEIPVFNHHAGHLSAIYARRYIESSQKFEDARRLTSTEVEALDLLDELVNDPDIHLKMAFQPGDMQFLHNHTIFHDRLAYQDWPEPERKRHLLRLWLAIPGAPPLPEVYAERYGAVTVGDRGGIVVDGTQLTVPLEP